MQHNWQASVLDVTPKRVELGQRGGAPPLVAIHRCRLDQRDLGAVVQDVVEFASRFIDDARVDTGVE